jgi:hypothetical protein
VVFLLAVAAYDIFLPKVILKVAYTLFCVLYVTVTKTIHPTKVRNGFSKSLAREEVHPVMKREALLKKEEFKCKRLYSHSVL